MTAKEGGAKNMQSEIFALVDILTVNLCKAKFAYLPIPEGKRWDVRLDFVRQFKTELVRQLECLIFEKKSLFISVRERERERENES
jgi:hypothetical protein